MISTRSNIMDKLKKPIELDLSIVGGRDNYYKVVIDPPVDYPNWLNTNIDKVIMGYNDFYRNKYPLIYYSFTLESRAACIGMIIELIKGIEATEGIKGVEITPDIKEPNVNDFKVKIKI